MRRFLWIAAIVIFGVGLRLYVADVSAVDWDEDDYLSPARAFRELINEGKFSEIPNVQQNREHPPLVKLLYSVTLDEDDMEEIPLVTYRSRKSPLPENSLRNSRWQSVTFGGLSLLVVSLMNPFAGIALAILPLHVHFTSVAYLEALPVLFTSLMAYFYLKSQVTTDSMYAVPTNGGRDTIYRVRQLFRQPKYRYLALSAVFFGLAVACKYPYAWSGVALILHALVYKHFKFQHLVAWGLLAIVVWFSFNPYLWPNPPERLKYQVTYHEDYAENQVETHSYTNPFEQLTRPNNYLLKEVRHPIWRGIAVVLFGLAVIGVMVSFWQKSYFAWWLILGWVFLMIWPTQWIQHKMTITVPYAVCAAVGFQWVYSQIRNWRVRRQTTVTHSV